MSDKTLVERLRDIVDESNKRSIDSIAKYVYPVKTSAAEDILGRQCLSRQDECELFMAIADTIEHEYLPRPRFEDGTPVQFGDKFKSNGVVGTVDYILKSNTEGCIIGRKEDNERVTYSNGKRVKRPEQEVLDTDGMPIKIGDTIYSTINAESLRVVEIDNSNWIICVGGINNERYLFPNPEIELTHKEPDTLERIKDDAIKAPRDYWGCYDTRCDFCPIKIDEGKKPYERYPGVEDCTSAQTLDLLHRQRLILEKTHG